MEYELIAKVIKERNSQFFFFATIFPKMKNFEEIAIILIQADIRSRVDVRRVTLYLEI